MASVYLAGPIAGLNYAGATDWRGYVKEELAKVNIDAYSPMRAKEYLVNKGILTATIGNTKHPLSTHKAIVSRDRFDATRCDILFVNLLGAKIVSIGTMMEMAWADLSRIPIVCVIEPDGNIHEHGFVQELINFRLPTIEEALLVTKAILL